MLGCSKKCLIYTHTTNRISYQGGHTAKKYYFVDCTVSISLASVSNKHVNWKKRDAGEMVSLSNNCHSEILGNAPGNLHLFVHFM